MPDQMLVGAATMVEAALRSLQRLWMEGACPRP